MTEANAQSELKEQLLSLVADRLMTGEVLISEAHFQQVMEEGFEALSGSPAASEDKKWLGMVVAKVNEQNPEVFVVPGVENWIIKSVLANVRKAGWGVVEIQEQGNQTIRQFLKEDKVQPVLAQLKITPAQLNQKRCFRSVLNQVAGKTDADQQRSAARLAQLKKEAASRPPPPAASTEESKAGPGLDELLSGPATEPSKEEADTRVEEQKKLQGEIRKKQMVALISHLDTYVQQGKLSAEDAERMRKAHKVDEAVRAGKVTAEKGSRIRNSVLDGTARDKIEKQVKDAVDYVVVYTQVFQALRRMDPKYDVSLRFLAQHKHAINADRNEDEDTIPEMGPAVTALIADVDCLRCDIEIMDRQEAEVRMIAARLPPYSYILRRDHQRVENMVVEPAFVDDLRNRSEEELGNLLHGADKKARARTAADLVCMSSLLGRLSKPTPIRKEIRLLKLNLIVEAFYRSTDDLGAARTKAQEFLRTRLKSIYPDMSEEEKVEIERRGTEMIDAVEQKIVTERQEIAARAAESGGDGSGGAAAEKDGDSVSEEEAAKGVVIARISMRVAGRVRNVPKKIMPDEDDASKFVLAQRDPETGEMIPVLRRGAKRFVQRGRDGGWELL